VITDIALAPRNANGKVEYETDVMIIRPVDRTKGNRRPMHADPIAQCLYGPAPTESARKLEGPSWLISDLVA
jgi:hypothetical protein